jgi:subtilisin family serine protease
MNNSGSKQKYTVKDTHGALPFEPLQAWAPAPARRAIELIPGGRRPVVAIVDTGVAADHWWFTGPEQDPVLVDAAAARDWAPPGDSEFGPLHGTFVAGVVRQTAPDATLLSVQLQRDANGFVIEGQIREALEWIGREVASGEAQRFVDVVCLATGFRVNDPERDAAYIDEVRTVCRSLAGAGVLVAAASGNSKWNLTEKVYPAALAPDLEHDAVPLVAVGATESDGELASFTIKVEPMTQQVGVGVFGTTPIGEWSFPKEVEEHTVLTMRRPQLTSVTLTGFGAGTGTSFAAAGYAGRLAQAMVNDAYAKLDDVSASTATGRAQRALFHTGYDRAG